MTDNKLTTASIVRARGDLLSTELSDTESVMLDMDEGSYFGVESVAKTIWDAIAEPVTVAKVCELVIDTYQASADEVETDTIAFLEDLNAAGLLDTNVE